MRHMFENPPVKETLPPLSRQEIQQSILANRIRRNSIQLQQQQPEQPEQAVNDWFWHRLKINIYFRFFFFVDYSRKWKRNGKRSWKRNFRLLQFSVDPWHHTRHFQHHFRYRFRYRFRFSFRWLQPSPRNRQRSSDATTVRRYFRRQRNRRLKYPPTLAATLPTLPTPATPTSPTHRPIAKSFRKSFRNATQWKTRATCSRRAEVRPRFRRFWRRRPEVCSRAPPSNAASRRRVSTASATSGGRWPRHRRRRRLTSAARRRRGATPPTSTASSRNSAAIGAATSRATTGSPHRRRLIGKSLINRYLI